MVLTGEGAGEKGYACDDMGDGLCSVVNYAVDGANWFFVDQRALASHAIIIGGEKLYLYDIDFSSWRTHATNVRTTRFEIQAAKVNLLEVFAASRQDNPAEN